MQHRVNKVKIAMNQITIKFYFQLYPLQHPKSISHSLYQLYKTLLNYNIKLKAAIAILIAKS